MKIFSLFWIDFYYDTRTCNLQCDINGRNYFLRKKAILKAHRKAIN